MNAWAAETAAHGANAVEPFYATAEFMVAIAMLIFLFLLGRRAFNLLGVALDDRAEKIKNRIDEAARLADEAQTTLASYERKQRDAAEEAESILSAARREAERLTADAKVDLQQALRRREAQAMERIAQAEQAAIDEVRGRAVDVAIDATRKLLAEQLTPAQQNALIDSAIKELPSRLH